MSTARKTAETERTARAASGAQAAGGRYLVVFEPGSSRVVALPDAGELIIGRGAEASLRLSDAKVSRKHARLVISAERVIVVDLGSQNGTRVNGERLGAPRALASGDVIDLSQSSLVLHVPPAPLVMPARAIPFEAWCVDAAHELDRAAVTGRPAAILALQLAAPVAEEALAALGPALDPLERATAEGRERLLVSVPESDEPTALIRSGSFVHTLGEAGMVARAGVAVLPSDGCDLSALLDGARTAALVAAPGGHALARDTARVVKLGDREVLVADPAMLRLHELAKRLAASDLPVLIQGETGAGKELIALMLHEHSPRRARRMIALNCAALAETLVESELFGHERGAFTGAHASRAGLLESADGGTVFLDEVAELTPATQAKLLRALDSKKITRVGDTRERAIDVRLVAATHRDLGREVGAGRFRSDLYFRLGAATLWLPPLRDRPRELVLLAHRFLASATARLGRPPMRLGDDALRALAAHPWPGNVRELEHTIVLLATLHDVPVLEPFHVGEALARSARTSVPPPPPSLPPVAPSTFRSLEDEVAELERTRMRTALEATNGHQRKAAALLGVPLRTFVTKLARYGLQKRPSR